MTAADVDLVKAWVTFAVQQPLPAAALGEVARAHQLVESCAAVGKVILLP